MLCMWLLTCAHQALGLAGPKEADYFLTFHQFLNTVSHNSLCSPMWTKSSVPLDGEGVCWERRQTEGAVVLEFRPQFSRPLSG